MINRFNLLSLHLKVSLGSFFLLKHTEKIKIIFILNYLYFLFNGPCLSNNDIAMLKKILIIFLLFHMNLLHFYSHPFRKDNT
jgi:hypothetical protein